MHIADSTGACVSTEGGRCVHSRGWPNSKYHALDNCTVSITGADRMSAVGLFEMEVWPSEKGVDSVHIDRRQFASFFY